MPQDSLISINQESLKTRQELVTDAIRTAILHGKFRPGDRLDQADLADELNVSRSPVRDAMRTLAAEQLVTYYPHRGNVVTERSIPELYEILHIRKLLEGSAARRAAEHMTDTRLEHLRLIIDEAQASTDMNQVLELNNTFHVTLYLAYEQPFLVEHIQKLRNKMAPYNRVFLDGPGHKDSAWQEHEKIYRACISRDGDLAEQEARLHLESVLDKIITTLEK
jgi:DNA-binding GntR family transcriptional regulator